MFRKREGTDCAMEYLWLPGTRAKETNAVFCHSLVCVWGGGELGVGCVLTSHLFCFKTGSHIAVGDTPKDNLEF